LGEKLTAYRRRGRSSVAFLTPIALDPVTVIPCTPIAVRASRTHRLEWLEMAMTIFMSQSPVGPGPASEGRFQAVTAPSWSTCAPEAPRNPDQAVQPIGGVVTDFMIDLSQEGRPPHTEMLRP
jgi:hypothetical protein